MSDHEIIHSTDPSMRKLLKTAETVAHARATVLISGESGTGKELLARYIHSRSPRSLEKFIAVNCAAVPEGLLESELFGYEKGAFTGAFQRKLGKFEMANNSTFLLDEISEMPLILQAKLLRVLQEGEVERLGGNGPIRVNVRLIATTNRSLEDMVKMGQFRQDLLYRLQVVPLHIPPLRDRPRDIQILAEHFLEVFCATSGMPLKSITPSALRKLMSWKWPGNVRELQNVIERSALLAKGERLDEENVIISCEEKKTESAMLVPGMTVAEAEKALILKTLAFTRQNRSEAAQMLGISVRTLRNKLNEYRGGAHESIV